jgi:hypothetical protein
MKKNDLVIWELQKDYGEGEIRRTITMLIRMPALEGFYAKVKNLINDALKTYGTDTINLPIPVAHITLYTIGGVDGIGLASQEEFEDVRVGRR